MHLSTSTNAIVALGLTLSAAFASSGCSSNGAPSSNFTSETGSASSSTDAGVAGNGATDASTADAAPETEACIELADPAQNAFNESFYGGTPLSDSCATDDDCVFAAIGPTCAPGCSTIFAKASLPAAQAAADNASLQCATFDSQGCTAVAPPCTPTAQSPICVSNHCTAGYASAWTSFALEADMGGTGSALPVACSGTDCLLWTVTPDGSIASKNPTESTTAKLSSADFTTIDTILRSENFRQEEMYSITCGVPVAGETRHMSESITRGTVLLGADITGCVTSGPSGNDFVNLYNIVSKY